MRFHGSATVSLKSTKGIAPPESAADVRGVSGPRKGCHVHSLSHQKPPKSNAKASPKTVRLAQLGRWKDPWLTAPGWELLQISGTPHPTLCWYG